MGKKPPPEECRQTIDSFYDKSSLNLLYGGMRNTLFVDPHPLGGLSAANVGLKVGKAFFDLKEQQFEYKESGWRVKMNIGGTNLLNLKRKIGAKTAGKTRNNIQFGTDESHFGTANKQKSLSIGGMYTLGIGGIITTTRLKLFTDAMELFADANVAGVQLGVDVRAEEGGGFTGFLGASYGLSISPFLKNVHVGTVVAIKNGPYYAEMKFSAGLFSEVPLPSVKKAIVGIELFNKVNSGPAALCGAELTLNDEDRVIAKVGDNGIAHISFIKQFKGIDLRMGIEGPSFRGPLVGLGGLNFGARVTLKQ